MKETCRWWDAEKDVAHELVFRLVRELSDRNRPDKERMLRCARLYDPNALFQGANIDISSAPWPYADNMGGCVINLVQSAVDTVRSMISKNRPRASFQTSGADFTTTRLAKDLEKYCEAKAHQVAVYDDLETMFSEAATVGPGFIKVFSRDGMVDVEPVPWEAIEVDPNECIAGEPRSMHEVRFVSRPVLAAMFPDDAEFIETVPEKNGVEDDLRRLNSYQQFDSDTVPVIESWHIPSGKKAADGRHSICAEGKTLLWEDWTRDHFPIVKFEWAKRPRCYWGIGLGEQLAGIQNRINRLYSYISRCHNLANSFLSVGAGDATIKLKASGGPGSSPVQVLVRKDPNVPMEFLTPQLVQSEVYQHLIWLIQMGYQLAGISENAARSEIPRQFESAVSINTYNDVQTQRFSIQSQRYEKVGLRVFELMIEEQAELGSGKDSEVYYRSRNVVERLKFPKSLTRDMYVMSIEASSVMSMTPAAKLQQAIELGNAGLYERDELRRLIGHPDLERVNNLKNAALDHAEAIVEQLIDGKYNPPEPMDNIAVCLQSVTNAFMKAKDEGAPEDILDGFRLWVKQATDMLNMAPPAPEQPPGGAPQPGAAPPGMPPGMAPPMPPPGPAPPPIDASGMTLG